MKPNRFIIVFLIFPLFLFSQTETGPVINDFGEVYPVEQPDLLLTPGNQYKVIFDVHTNPGKQGQPNPLINTVARFLNMHARTGIDVKNLDVVLVLHGEATSASLSPEAYSTHFKTNNPDYELLKSLQSAGVKIFVCGQSFVRRGYKQHERSQYVKMALSALTALVRYQTEGYSLITFN